MWCELEVLDEYLSQLVCAMSNFYSVSMEFYIVTLSFPFIWQHESATRTVDDNVWTEIRNFKKCLIMMFAKQEKEVVFLETVMGLAQQRRHCMVECIPLPEDIAKEAPLYFKKVRCRTSFSCVVLTAYFSPKSMLFIYASVKETLIHWLLIIA